MNKKKLGILGMAAALMMSGQGMVGPSLLHEPEPPTPLTPEQEEKALRLKETAIQQAEQKRQRKQEQRELQELRVRANLWWRKIATDQQWELTRKHWPKVNWQEFKYFNYITNGHIVFMYKQENQ